MDANEPKKSPRELSLLTGAGVGSLSRKASEPTVFRNHGAMIAGVLTKTAYFVVIAFLIYASASAFGITSLGAIATGSLAFLEYVVRNAFVLFLGATGWLILLYPIAVIFTLCWLYNWLNAFSRADKVEIADDGLVITWTGRNSMRISWEEMQSVILFCPHHTMLPRKWGVVIGTARERPVQINLKVFEGKGQLLLDTIKAKARWLAVDPALVELWEPVIADSHTELWLKSLSAAPKGEELLPLFPGAKLGSGKYTVSKRLAVGGQGTAYLATGTGSDVTVVIKETLFPVYVDAKIRSEAERRFKHEVDLLGRLHHPQIVSLHESFIEDHRGYLVLEYIDGDSLRAKVRRDGALPPGQVEELAKQMCTILDYLHTLEPAVIHRDFTPDNLMLDLRGELKLIDFNVAREVESTRTATVVGKHAYIPPEQFRGDTCVQSDLYALGATLYFLLAGRDPEPISQSRPSEAGVELTQALDDLVAKCTDTELVTRFQSAVEISEALHAGSVDSQR
ncbi:MAG: serine/threonine protein kinase [Candidatus Obscuribacterales bacterium]|nr:serine/threonine protein kinase [Candidatus Obscuribacterales bacterium]